MAEGGTDGQLCDKQGGVSCFYKLGGGAMESGSLHRAFQLCPVLAHFHNGMLKKNEAQ